ncbi:Multicopper oxidase [Gigaspora rosea]|uniref:Multicopper oxidase n=1 Tax=Gigaspora rosea TaxID=44941 RepID=A0A397VMN8_9GLOM|nr:Multicopper oxidase [Gigaspora rosea]
MGSIFISLVPPVLFDLLLEAGTSEIQMEPVSERPSELNSDPTLWTVNGQYPAPIIQANYGDRILINVTNKLGDASLARHKSSKGHKFYDGPVGVTQCPIPNGVSFLYNFTLDQYGTYWYHSHIIGQIIDGLKGPLIVHFPNDPYLKEYDFEYVMTLSDWYHTPSGILLPLYRTPGYIGFEPVPNSGEISGLGQYDCNAAPKNSKCNSNNIVATYVVKKGKKYRFRIINMSTESHFILSFDEHPLMVIEADGDLIKPVTLNTLPINVAQRYSVILNANKPIDNYQIRAKLSTYTRIDNNTINYNNSLNNNIVGILRYEGAKDNLPTSNAYPLNQSEECRDINANFLRPYYEINVPRNIITKINLFVAFTVVSSLKFVQINNSSFVVPTLNYPTNQRIIQGVDPYRLPQYDNAYVYGCNYCEDAAVDIYITGSFFNLHPMHMHGHKFFVIYQGENNTGTQPPEESSFNLIDPPYRDVVTVQPNSTTVIRYFVNNPGVWLFHCHIHGT